MVALASEWPIHFYFSSETAEQNSMKLDRKQDLSVLYQVCVFEGNRKTKMVLPASNWPRHFYFSSETAEQNSRILDREQDLNILYKVCIFGAVPKTKMANPASDWLRHFLYFSSETAEKNSRKLDRMPDLNVLHKVFFRPIGKPRWPSWPICRQRQRIVLRCTICGPLWHLVYICPVLQIPYRYHTDTILTWQSKPGKMVKLRVWSESHKHYLAWSY